MDIRLFSDPSDFMLDIFPIYPLFRAGGEEARDGGASL